MLMKEGISSWPVTTVVFTSKFLISFVFGVHTGKHVHGPESGSDTVHTPAAVFKIFRGSEVVGSNVPRKRGSNASTSAVKKQSSDSVGA